MDGIGPREKRPYMINTHWGGVVETIILEPMSLWSYGND